MNFLFPRVVLAALFCCLTIPAYASFVIEPDTDGADDGPFTPSANFSFGGDTTTASTSIYVQDGPYPLNLAPNQTPLIGTTGGDSIFGGDGGTIPDTYLYSYARVPMATTQQFMAELLSMTTETLVRVQLQGPAVSTASTRLGRNLRITLGVRFDTL